jgi:hypothetical protein
MYKTTLSYADIVRSSVQAPRRTPPATRSLRARRKLLRFIAVPVAIVAIIAAILATYDIIAIQQQGNAPLAALRQFCAFETQQNYVGAYYMVSQQFASGFSVDDFEAINTARDQQYGTVTGCSQFQRDYTRAFGGANAAFSLTVSTTKGTYHGVVLLALEVNQAPDRLDGNQEVWTIDQVTPDAHLE